MKSRLKVIWGLILLALVSCSTVEHKSGEVKTLVLKKTKDIQPVSSFISGVDYVELKYPAEIQPGRIEKLKIVNDEIVVVQNFSGKTSVLRFSKSGEFLSEIGKSNLRNPRDIVLYNDEFAVWDDAGVKAFSKNGEFQRILIKTHAAGNRFFYSNSKFYLFHENTAPGFLSEYSIDGKKEHVFHPVKETFESNGNASISPVSEKSFHLFSPISDTIFVFANEKLLPKYIVEGKSHPTYIQVLEKVISMSDSDKRKYIHNNQHWAIKSFFENENFIFVDYNLGSYPFVMLIRKSDWKATYIKEFINDIDGGVWDDPFYLSNDDKLYIPLTSYQISGHTIANKKRHDFEDQMEKAQQNNNPVIMICKLKME